ncbi:MAG: phosphoribosyltransferase family protein [Pseudolysinimonas sp.]|uniref:ComF family protein n=1 Tax=Pseudolysinimonas sp. TaxID=2680009 RepID=UPI003267BAF3
MLDRLVSALAYLFPVPCAGCGREGRALCGDCAARLRPEPISHDVAGVGTVWSALRYEGVTRDVVLAVKEGGRPGLVSTLARPFAAAVDAALASQPNAILVPVPPSRASRRRRGFDPVELLATRAGVLLTPVFAPAAPHPVQKGLDVLERSRNLDGVFALRRTVAGCRVLLVDDLVTTGSTLRAAADVLGAGQARVLGAVTLAATPRFDGRSSGTLSRSS